MFDLEEKNYSDCQNRTQSKRSLGRGVLRLCCSRQGINKLESRTGHQRDFHWSLCWGNGSWGQRL